MSFLSEDEILDMSTRQLRVECENAGLDKKGRYGKLLKRLLKWSREQKALVESQRRISHAEDLICPITKELPFDPVTAEDGRL